MARGLIRRYIWLIDTIRSAKGITFDEINRKWRQSSQNEDGEDWKKRTFFQNINDIWDEFRISIICDRRITSTILRMMKSTAASVTLW